MQTTQLHLEQQVGLSPHDLLTWLPRRQLLKLSPGWRSRTLQWPGLCLSSAFIWASSLPRFCDISWRDILISDFGSISLIAFSFEGTIPNLYCTLSVCNMARSGRWAQAALNSSIHWFQRNKVWTVQGGARGEVQSNTIEKYRVRLYLVGVLFFNVEFLRANKHYQSFFNLHEYKIVVLQNTSKHLK